MPSNHLILCHPLLLLPSIFPAIRVFSNESALCIRWPKHCSFSFSPSTEYWGLISFRNWFDLLAVQGTLKSLLQYLSSKASILQRSAFWQPLFRQDIKLCWKLGAASQNNLGRGLSGWPSVWLIKIKTFLLYINTTLLSLQTTIFIGTALQRQQDVQKAHLSAPGVYSGPALSTKHGAFEPLRHPSALRWVCKLLLLSVAQSLSRVRLWPRGQQHARLPLCSLSPSLLKLMSVQSMMTFYHLILSPPSPPAISGSPYIKWWSTTFIWAVTLRPGVWRGWPCFFLGKGPRGKFQVARPWILEWTGLAFFKMWLKLEI